MTLTGTDKQVQYAAAILDTIIAAEPKSTEGMDRRTASAVQSWNERFARIQQYARDVRESDAEVDAGNVIEDYRDWFYAVR